LTDLAKYLGEGTSQKGSRGRESSALSTKLALTISRQTRDAIVRSRKQQLDLLERLRQVGFWQVLPQSIHRTVFMHPVDYVLQNLYRSREEVIAHPEWFEPDSLERIDKAILYIQEAKFAEGTQAA